MTRQITFISKLLMLLIIAVLLDSCCTVFMPKREKVTINAGNKDSKIFLDKEEIGTGSAKLKVKKDGAHQIVVQTPGYKDTYYCLMPTHRPIAYYPLEVLNCVTVVYAATAIILDNHNPKNLSYDKVTNIPIEDKIVERKKKDKFIDISNIKLNIKDKNKDIILENVAWSRDLDAAMKEADKKQKAGAAKAEMKEFKKSKKKKKGATLKEDNEVKADDIIFTENVYKTLKKSGFVDTVNRVFADNNNTLVLEGEVKKVTFYQILSKKNIASYLRVKLDLVWYIKNTYDEKIDSISTQDLSGDFNIYSSYYTYKPKAKSEDETDNLYSKMFADAIDISYLNLHKNPTMAKYIKQENDFTISDPMLSLVAPKNNITDKADASLASVIVKTAQGHGSGFAITQDGYIITNYHVIAGKVIGKPNAVKVITANGDELEGKVVRYNKYRDLALIKVDKKFEKAFKVSNVKSFKNMQDVYTIGAPKSIELGQSVSSGVISNERKNNNNNLLQLGMSVNGGNSGGPVFDSNGTLHGVIESKLIGKNTEGVAFAIPSYMIQEYLNIKY